MLVIPRLPSGKSTIQLRARVRGLSLDSYEYVSLTLQTKIPLWRQDWFFPALFGLFAMIGLFALVLMYRARLLMVKATREARISQVQAIQSQMNPHFIFNVLASLQTMILGAETGKANAYLVKLSNLIRGFLDASVSTGIYKNGEKQEILYSLSREMEILDNYIEFQQLIYPGRFEYRIDTEKGLDPDHIMIPPMLLQPLAENAIRHGLLPKKGKGLLSIEIFTQSNTELCIRVSDDGIGIRKAEETQRLSQLRFISRSRELTQKRIRLLNELGIPIRMEIQSDHKGTIVTIFFRTNFVKHEE
jgi:sensor histidine kinase YesM